MESSQDQILQLSDLVSTKECALRIELGDASQTLGFLLDKYVKNPPLAAMLRDSRITQSSADTLYALQDLVYVSSGSGCLLDMFSGVVFKDGDSRIELDQVPANHLTRVAGQEVSVIDVTIDRMNVFYDRNWTGFHARKWLRDADKYSGFVRSALADKSAPPGAEAILELNSTDQKLRFLDALAKTVWDAQFENYSRFIGKKLVFKSGDETIDNIIQGAGAICSEKVQALKFLTDHYGFKSEYIIAGENATGPVPVERLRELLTTFDFRFSKRHMRFWQHTALLYDVDGIRVLVDATNGNIPFLFLRDPGAERILGYKNKLPVTVKMIEMEEDFYYHQVPQDIPENLFFALEGWMAYTDLMQVFDNELGLYLSGDYYVTPIPFKSEKEFHKDRLEYTEVCQRTGLECSITGEWTLESPLGRDFTESEPRVSEAILAARDHLLTRLDLCDGPGHESGLVIIKLRN